MIETDFELTRKDLLDVRADVHVLFLADGFDEAIDGLAEEPARHLAAALRRRGFKAGLAACEVVDVPVARGGSRLVIAAGLGKPGELDVAALQKAAAAASRAVLKLKPAHVAAALPAADGLPEWIDPHRRAWAVLTGLMLGGYRFEQYVSDESKKTSWPETLTVCVGDGHGPAARALEQAEALVDGAVVARDLVNEPAGALNPETYAKRVQELAKQLDLEVEVFSKPAIERERMHALLTVAKGSDVEPRVVHLVSRPSEGAPRARLVLIGKGVTFDTGGYNLKIGTAMDTMKCDMAGSAAVVGAMVALAHLAPRVEVHGLIGLVENMISGRAYRPTDVLDTRSGKTVEVMNTDAEGRLVLADLLDYACEELEPDGIVDLATLTGACKVALGPMATGAMTNHEPLRSRVLEAAEQAGELVWPLPLYRDYRQQLESPVADMKNIGNRWGGALTAGLFLQEFVKGDVPWVHLDIAGPAFLDSDHPFWGRGGTGAGVATLVELARSLERRGLSAEDAGRGLGGGRGGGGGGRGGRRGRRRGRRASVRQ